MPDRSNTQPVKSDCSVLGGADGMVADADGSLIIAGGRQNTVLRASKDGEIDFLVKEEDALDFPASVWIATVNGTRSLFIANAAFGESEQPRPGLLSYGPLP